MSQFLRQFGWSYWLFSGLSTFESFLANKDQTIEEWPYGHTEFFGAVLQNKDNGTKTEG